MQPLQNKNQANNAILVNLPRQPKRLKNKLVLKDQQGWEVISFDDIIHCKADSNYSKIFLKNGHSICTSKSLKQIEEKISLGDFIRVHQSHIVSINQIKRFDLQNGITLQNGDLIPVSRRRRQELLLIFT